MSNADNAGSGLRRADRPLVRLLAIALGIGVGVTLLGAAMVAVLGAPADGPRLAKSTSGSEPLECFAGIAPVAFLVDRIGGPYVHTEVLVQAGQDPHVFEPTPLQVIRLSKARLYFRIGIPFEDRLIEPVSGGAVHFTVVDTASGIDRLAASDEDEGPTDPHVWLSPPRLKTMAANVAAALCRADPPHEVLYQTNLKRLDAELDALDRRIAAGLAPYRGQAFYVFHPAFAYFAETYGLRQESVEVEGKSPTPRQVFNLVGMARRDRVKIIFLQPQFSQQIAASIAQAIGGAVVPMDDLAYDVMANLEDVAGKIAASNRGKMQ